MRENKRTDFTNQDFHIGIDVHKKNWCITIRNNQMELRTFSMNPSPEELYQHMEHNYPGSRYISAYEAGFCGFWIHRKLQAMGLRISLSMLQTLRARTKNGPQKPTRLIHVK